MGTSPNLLLVPLDYVYFESYTNNRYFMLKKRIDIVGHDYYLVNSEDLVEFCRLWHHMLKRKTNKKTLGDHRP